MPGYRFAARFFRKRLTERFRVMRPRNARSDAGRSGGIRRHAVSHVSLTHSSASSLFERILTATRRQNGPCFLSVSEMAVSSRRWYSSMISSSSIRTPPFSVLPVLSQNRGPIYAQAKNF